MSSQPGPNPLKSKGIPGLPKPWQNFLLYLMLFMALPLLPLLLEYWIMEDRISEQSVTLTAAMYAISIGIASRRLDLFAFTILVFGIFVCVFGVVMHAEHEKVEARDILTKRQAAGDKTPVNGLSDKDTLTKSKLCGFLAIGFVFLCHAGERYNRHVVDEKPAFEF